MKLKFDITLAKHVLFLINFLCFFAGIGCLCAGLWVLLRAYSSLEFMHFSGVNELATGFEEILQPDAFEQISYILIAAGGTVSVVSFLGCWGASSESKNILICYGALLALILLLEITAGGMVAASTRPISGSIKDSLKSSLTDHYVGADKNALTVLWDYTMANIKCCGVNSHEDFKDAKKFAQANKKVPEACCILQGDLAKLQPKNKTCTQEPTDSNSYWKNGCFVALMQRVWIHKLMAVGIGVGLALLQLLGVIFAFYFSGYILNDDNFSSDGEEGERGLYS